MTNLFFMPNQRKNMRRYFKEVKLSNRLNQKCFFGFERNQRKEISMFCLHADLAEERLKSDS